MVEERVTALEQPEVRVDAVAAEVAEQTPEVLVQ